MSKASGPRTSPMMMRSGRMRSALRTSSRCGTAPTPSILGARVSICTTCGCCSRSSTASSIVMMRSRLSMPRETALSKVVLPEPEPPQISTLARIRATTSRKRAIAGDRLALRTMSSSVRLYLGNLRIEIVPPLRTSGPSTMLTRLPSASRASTSGLASSMRRPTAAAMRCATLTTCWTSRKRAAVFSNLPSRSTKTS